MVSPKIAQKKSIVQEVDAKKYFWCACGESANQPFCDGSHVGTGIEPLKVEFEEAKKVAWCACKLTANPPFCDGAHKKL